jgi:hypothetical protein
MHFGRHHHNEVNFWTRDPVRQFLVPVLLATE